MRTKDLQNPFDCKTEHSKRSSYRYYKLKYDDMTHDDILRHIGVTRNEIEVIDSDPPSIYDPPDGEIIHECPQYIYYKDKVWSKERWTLMSMRYCPRLKVFKTYLRDKQNKTRVLYTIGTIPPKLPQ